MHISLDGKVAGPNGEMNWIKADKRRRHCIVWAANESDDGKLLAYCWRQAERNQA